LKVKRPHIVFLTPWFAESEQDSISIPALQVYLKSLRKVLPDCRMTLISFQYPFTVQSYIWHGIDIIPLNGGTKRLKKPFIWNIALRKLKKLHAKQPITAVHSFWIGECSRIGVRFAKKYGITHVNTVMGQDAKLGNPYTKSLSKSNTKIVTLSKNHQQILTDNYGINSIVIPWFIDIDEYPEIQENAVDILGVGSLISIKNYELFIDVISDLVKKQPQLTVEILGGGPHQKQLEKLILKTHLKNNIKLLGKIHRDKVLQKMATARLLLHTSSYESFGYVFIEALYSGMHVVSKDVGFVADIPEWYVANTQIELAKACHDFLTITARRKKRILLSSEKESVNAYLRLYHE